MTLRDRLTYTPTNAASQDASWMRSMEERVETLEAVSRLFRASIKGGAMTVYDDELKQVGRLGVGSYQLPGGGTRTAPVMAVSNADQAFHLLIDVEDGWIQPRWTYNFTEDTFVPVTSANFVSAWKASINSNGLALYTQFSVGADPGTTGELRLNIGGFDSDIQTVSAGTFSVLYWSWDLESILNIGSRHNLRVYAKRTSGTGNINVYSPDFTYMASKKILSSATPGGIPST